MSNMHRTGVEQWSLDEQVCLLDPLLYGQTPEPMDRSQFSSLSHVPRRQAPSEVPAMDTFGESERKLRSSCPSLPSSAGLYDHYGSIATRSTVRSVPETSIMDVWQSDVAHTSKPAAAREQSLGKLFQQGWTLSKVAYLWDMSRLPSLSLHLRWL